MTIITFFHGDKGGVGKSLFCKAYINFKMANNENNICIVDSDTQNPDISWSYNDIKDVELINLKTHDGWLDFGNFCEKNQGKEIIVNLPAGVGYHFKEEIGIIEDIIKALSVELKMFFSIDRQKTPLLQLKKTIELFKNIMPTKNIIVIKNGFFGATESKFYRWDTSDLKKKFESDGGKTIFVPELHERVIDGVGIVPFNVALKDKELAFTTRIELERWLKITKEVLCPNSEIKENDITE